MTADDKQRIVDLLIDLYRSDDNNKKTILFKFLMFNNIFTEEQKNTLVGVYEKDKTTPIIDYKNTHRVNGIEVVFWKTFPYGKPPFKKPSDEKKCYSCNQDIYNREVFTLKTTPQQHYHTFCTPNNGEYHKNPAYLKVHPKQEQQEEEKYGEDEFVL